MSACVCVCEKRKSNNESEKQQKSYYLLRAPEIGSIFGVGSPSNARSDNATPSASVLIP